MKIRMLLFLLFLINSCSSALFCTVAYSSDEIRAYFESSLNLYAVTRNSSGQVWHIADQQFEDWGTDANDADDYDIALTDKSGSFYVGDFNTAVSAGYYSLIIYQRAGDNPTDTDSALMFEEGYWDGTTWRTGSKQLQNIITDTNEIQEDWANDGRLDTILDSIKEMTDLIVLVSTTVSSADDANSFTLTAGQATADAYNGMNIAVKDANDSHYETRRIEDWTAGRVVTVDSDFSFTPAESDVAYIWGISYVGLLDSIYELLSVPVYHVDSTSSVGIGGGGATYYTSDGTDP